MGRPAQAPERAVEPATVEGIRRRIDGTIDSDFYGLRAAVLRRRAADRCVVRGRCRLRAALRAVLRLVLRARARAPARQRAGPPS